MPSAKQPQILVIEPEGDLVFKGPFTEVVTTHLFLTNPSDRRVCFKVKTTAPRRYCVRPNSGFIDPDDKVDVSVMLQPLDADTQDKSKHKFMVQSMYASVDATDVEVLWSQAASGDLMDSKLRCVFQNEGAEQLQGAPVTPPSPPTETVEPPVKIASPTVTSTKEAGDQSELNTLMEECKRLQAENAKLKQKQKEFTPTPIASKVAPSNDVTEQMRNQIILFSAIAFVIGFLLGYIL